MEQMEKLQKGASYPAVTDAEVRSQILAFPPLTEQQRIVAILDEAFAGIATAAANAELNLANARELFESYLQSVFENKGEDWVNSNIGQYTRFIDYRGKTPTKTESGLRLITAKKRKNGLSLRIPYGVYRSR